MTRIYMDPTNCADCELIQLGQSHLDRCGGIRVVDGTATEGTLYRYQAFGKLCFNPSHRLPNLTMGHCRSGLRYAPFDTVKKSTALVKYYQGATIESE